MTEDEAIRTFFVRKDLVDGVARDLVNGRPIIRPVQLAVDRDARVARRRRLPRVLEQISRSRFLQRFAPDWNELAKTDARIDGADIAVE